jgi:hypothetical protein
MTTRQFHPAPPARSTAGGGQAMLPVADTSDAVIAGRRAIAGGRAGAQSGGMPTAAVRHALRALASETGPKAGLRGVKLLRPIVAEAHEALRERLEAGGLAEDYLRGRARLADSVVVGLLHIASISTGVRGGSMVAPLAAIATGGYGRRELAPGSDLDLLFLLPDRRESRAGGDAATAACVSAVVAGLWDLGFVLDHAARSSRECLDLAHSEPAVLASLLDRRFLWGGFGLFAALDADLAGVARRLGFDEPSGTSSAPRLLRLFRRHAHNVLRAAALTTESVSAQPQ